MFYRAELEFLQKLLQRWRIGSFLTSPEELGERNFDLGLRAYLGRRETLWEDLRGSTLWINENTIYKFTDAFYCSYSFLILPHMQPRTILLIGPYIAFSMTQPQLMEIAERCSLSPAQLGQLEHYYDSVPVLSNESLLFTVMTAFGETIWGENDAFSVVDISQETSGLAPLPREGGESTAEESAMKMQMMEQRYAFENRLMRDISRGQNLRVEQMLKGAQVHFEQRSPDPLRNAKNYCIICNTLMRKAAENGGVHPVYLDSTSSGFALRIEALHSLSAVNGMLLEMLRAYCRLVRKNASRHYSPPVEKTVTYIDFDLSADLSLHTLSERQNMNPSYFSALFRQETGQTLTDFVARRRMDRARELLTTTALQVQTIAQYTGYADMNYFSKVFKKYTGQTPSQYRRSHRKDT